MTKTFCQQPEAIMNLRELNPKPPSVEILIEPTPNKNNFPAMNFLRVAVKKADKPSLTTTLFFIFFTVITFLNANATTLLVNALEQ
ncbi:hypothetical protein [Marinicella marina]|uniref:hypothetical protein n=1 Tax=Marinicella marina TaxID=2996016 RepID=UPI002260F4D7|nr:hypothetical protein [Marinicella marina]MDJ1141168.1 hypothetical protein [Marinicella marina]